MPDINYRLPYWQNGTDELREVTSQFLSYVNNQSFHAAGNIQAPTEAQFTPFKQYITLWMNYSGWKIKEGDAARFQQLKTSVTGLVSFPDTKEWLNEALYFGIDPF